jgi:hypothetical protein
MMWYTTVLSVQTNRDILLDRKVWTVPLEIIYTPLVSSNISHTKLNSYISLSCVKGLTQTNWYVKLSTHIMMSFNLVCSAFEAPFLWYKKWHIILWKFNYLDCISTSCVIFLYSASGHIISKFSWYFHDVLVTEHIRCVMSQWTTYNILVRPLQPFCSDYY